MSKSIVKQSLEIFDKPFEGNGKTGKEKSKVKQRLLKSSTGNQKISIGLSIEKKYSGQTIDQIRKKHQKKEDRTEENLQKLIALSRKPLNKERTTSLFVVDSPVILDHTFHVKKDRNTKCPIFKRGNRSREEPEIVKPVEGTVFTEDDFAMFEREYVVD